MPTPKKEDVLHRARALAIEKQVRQGLPAITPTEHELKETGAWEKAKLDLMRVDQNVRSEQRHYLEDMAGEMGLSIISKKEVQRAAKPKTLYKMSASRKVSVPLSTLWKRALGSKIKRLPIIDVRKPRRKRSFKKLPTVKELEKKTGKPKKRQKNHSARSGLTMRSLRKVTGVKMFAFSDDVWKVKKPRKRRKRK